MKVKEDKCTDILESLEKALKRHDNLQQPILNAEGYMNDSKYKLKELWKAHSVVENKIRAALLPTSPFKITFLGLAITASHLLALRRDKAVAEQNIKNEQQKLAGKQKKLEELERKRENHRQNAEELSRRYQTCLGRNQNPRN